MGMKLVVLLTFDLSSLATAHKTLWDHCGDHLKQLGLSYHVRRGSEKRQVADMVFTDIITAFDKLDSAEKLPAIFCEATELIRLPCLAPDPVSAKLEGNSSVLDSLTNEVHNLPSLVAASSSESLVKCCSSLDGLIADLRSQLSQFSSSITSFSHGFETFSRTHLSSDSTLVSKSNLNGSNSSASPSVSAVPTHPRDRDRSNNLVLFGLPETSLLDTDSAIDDMSTHLIGKVVRASDALRLGRKPDINSQSCPRPILIKFESCWDKRLILASCRKLKGYSNHKLFIREDLPPEAHPTRRAVTDRNTSNSATSSSNSNSDPPPNLTSVSVDTYSLDIMNLNSI